MFMATKVLYCIVVLQLYNCIVVSIVQVYLEERKELSESCCNELCVSIYFSLKVMPQLLIHLKVDSTDASIDWGTLLVYTCADSCQQDNKYVPEFIWKQDFSMDQLPV